jgi:hypothetical protein
MTFLNRDFYTREVAERLAFWPGGARASGVEGFEVSGR